jgi:GT2 family glycosyltransferase
MIPAAIVPTLTRHDLLSDMLASWDEPTAHLLIIDNSGRGFAVPDGPWDRVTVLRMPSNIGVAASWNLGIKAFPEVAWWMFCSDDVRWAPGSLGRLSAVSGIEWVTLCGTSWAAFTVGQAVVDRVGLFDERYYPAYFEDDDYLWRCGQAGVEVRSEDVRREHEPARTLHTPGARFDRSRSLAANSTLFDRKRAQGDTGWGWERRRVLGGRW